MNHQRASVGVSDMAFQFVPTAGTTSYGAADSDNGLTTAGGASMAYDFNHNLTYDGYNTLTYDVENRMVEAENAAWGASQYLYDPLGQRKQKTVGVGSPMPVTTQFVLAGGEEIGDYYAASGTWRLTVRGVGGLPLAAVVPAADGMSEQIAYVHHDVQGSTVALTTAGTSGPAETYTYSDYGAPQSGSWSAYQYAGYRYDSETGLYYVKARYYNPNLGRFLQTDPIGLSGGTNLYAYVGNDPINLFDPTGLMAEETQNDGAAQETINSTSAVSNQQLNFIADLPFNTPGTLTINTYLSGDSGISSAVDGHAWLTYTSDAGVTTTWGTWGNTNGAQGLTGVNEDTELTYQATASRTVYLNANQATSLSTFITGEVLAGPSAWSYEYPCSGFASTGWTAATGEFLNPQQGGILSTPTNLQNAIVQANGGQSFGVLANPHP
jgi:RHS repeat-associated protein